MLCAPTHALKSSRSTGLSALCPQRIAARRRRRLSPPGLIRGSQRNIVDWKMLYSGRSKIVPSFVYVSLPGLTIVPSFVSVIIPKLTFRQ